MGAARRSRVESRLDSFIPQRQLADTVTAVGMTSHPCEVRILPRLALVAAAALGALYLASASVTGLPDDRVRAAKDFNQAQAYDDAAALSRLLADDYVLLNSRLHRSQVHLDPSLVREPVERV